MSLWNLGETYRKVGLELKKQIAMKTANIMNIIIKHNREEKFENIIANMYPNGVTESQLNDFLNLERDFIFEQLDIKIK